MPMRGELVIPAMRLTSGATGNRDTFPVVLFCLAGLVISVWLASSQPFDQISMLIVQYNLW